jgi:peroxiredoxin
MGLELDGTGFGLGTRSQRYAAVIEDGVVSGTAARWAPWATVRAARGRVGTTSETRMGAGNKNRPGLLHEERLALMFRRCPQVKALNVEPGGGLTCSAAKSVLEIL